MANEPLKGVAPQVQTRPIVPQQPVAQPAAPAATQQVAPEVSAQPAASVEPVRERTTEQFDKLIESNTRLFQQQQAQGILIQQLLQQGQQRGQQDSAPQQQPRQQNPGQPRVDMQDFIEKDPATGEQYINEQKLRSTLTQIQQEAVQAREIAQNYQRQQEDRERDRQEREAYSIYPELNPRDQSKYDQDFNKKTRAFLTDSMLNPLDYGGRALSFKEAADIVRAGARPTATQVAVAQAVEEAQPAQAASAAPTANQINKEQAAASVANQPLHVQSEISAEELQEKQLRTRMGDDEALADRLMHTEHIFGEKSNSGQPE